MIKHFLNYFSFSILNAALTFLISIYLARNLTIEEFGMVGIFFAISFFLKPLAALNSLRLVSIEKNNLSNSEFQKFSNYFISLSLLWCFILVLLSLLIAPYFEDYIFLIYYLPLYIFIVMLGEFHSLVLIQTKDSKKHGVYIFFTRLFTLLFIYIYMEFFTYSWIVYLVALFIAEIIVIGLRVKYGFHSLRNYKFSINFFEYKKIITYGLPLIVLLIGSFFLNQSDKFIVLNFFGLKEVAFYTIGYQVGSILNTVNQSLTNTLVPIIYKCLKKTPAKALPLINRYLLLYTLFIIVTLIILFFSAKNLIPFLYGVEYTDSIYVVVFISIAFGLNGIYILTNFIMDYYKYNILKVKLIYLSACVNVIISIIFIDSFGILAPAIGTVMAYLILSILSQYYGRIILNGQCK
jgi:O-antigen/teichoic acid export membrane protein